MMCTRIIESTLVCALHPGAFQVEYRRAPPGLNLFCSFLCSLLARFSSVSRPSVTL